MTEPLAAPELPDLDTYAETSSLFVDIAAVLDGGLPEAPAPTVCRRSDGVGLFYAGEVNVLFGDPESGKTWVAFAAVSEVLKEGGRAFVLDADHNGHAAVLSRLIALGVSLDVLKDRGRFLLAEPESESDLLAMVRTASAWRPAVAVVDSVGEVLPLMGLNSNSPDDFTAAKNGVLLPLATAGAAVVAIDHLAKSSESRQSGPTGTAAKGRVVGGANLRVTIREPFTPGRGGSAVLSVRKDRHGGLRRVSPRARSGAEQTAGNFRLESHGDGTVSWSVIEGDNLTRSEMGSAFVPTMEQLSAVHSLSPTARTQRGIKGALGVGSDKALAVLKAYNELSEVERASLLRPGLGERGADG